MQLRDGFDCSQPLTDIEREFRSRWPDNVFHFPATKQGRLDAENPLSAYVFVRPPIDASSFERSSLIAAVLRDPATRQVLYVTERELKRMTPLPPFPPIGTSVRVTAGDYEGLEGTIVEVTCTTAKVLIELWSRKRILTLAANELQCV